FDQRWAGPADHGGPQRPAGLPRRGARGDQPHRRRDPGGLPDQRVLLPRLVVHQPLRARHAGGPGDLDRRGVPVEAGHGGVPLRAEVLKVPPERMALVAAHDWDCHGAKRAGLTTGWVSRKSGGFGAPFAPPDVVGEDLTEVAAKLLALEPRGDARADVPPRSFY